jgi:4a-hydroxytetrahydrobiopterin dehydratase
MTHETPAGWTLDADGRLTRGFKFGSFPEAIAFMVRVGMACEARNHHPDWTNSYDRVSVVLVTHDAGRVTEKDVELARLMNDAFRPA